MKGINRGTHLTVRPSVDRHMCRQTRAKQGSRRCALCSVLFLRFHNFFFGLNQPSFSCFCLPFSSSAFRVVRNSHGFLMRVNPGRLTWSLLIRRVSGSRAVPVCILSFAGRVLPDGILCEDRSGRRDVRKVVVFLYLFCNSCKGQFAMKWDEKKEICSMGS